MFICLRMNFTPKEVGACIRLITYKTREEYTKRREPSQVILEVNSLLVAQLYIRVRFVLRVINKMGTSISLSLGFTSYRFNLDP